MEFTPLLEQYGVVKFLLYELGLISLIACPALSQVYVIGRYLFLVGPKADRIKNILGLIWMFILSFVVIGWFQGYRQELLLLSFKSRESLVGYILESLAHFSFAILYYAYVCWGMFDKMKENVGFLFKKIFKKS